MFGLVLDLQPQVPFHSTNFTAFASTWCEYFIGEIRTPKEKTTRVKVSSYVCLISLSVGTPFVTLPLFQDICFLFVDAHCGRSWSP